MLGLTFLVVAGMLASAGGSKKNPADCSFQLMSVFELRTAISQLVSEAQSVSIRDSKDFAQRLRQAASALSKTDPFDPLVLGLYQKARDLIDVDRRAREVALPELRQFLTGTVPAADCADCGRFIKSLSFGVYEALGMGDAVLAYVSIVDIVPQKNERLAPNEIPREVILPKVTSFNSSQEFEEFKNLVDRIRQNIDDTIRKLPQPRGHAFRIVFASQPTDGKWGETATRKKRSADSKSFEQFLRKGLVYGESLALAAVTGADLPYWSED